MGVTPTSVNDSENTMDNVHPVKVPFWLNPKIRAIFYQIGVLGMVGMLAWYLISNTLHNLERQSVATGFAMPIALWHSMHCL